MQPVAPPARARIPPKARRSAARSTVAALLSLGAAACGDGAGASADSLDGLPRLVVQEEMRIGDRDDPSHGFTLPTAAQVDADGSIYLVEAAVPEVRVYGADGELRRRFGREGNGPGEYQSITNFGLLPDTVWIVDSRQDRITLLDREGEVISTGRVQPARIPLPEGYGYLLPASFRPDRTFLGAMHRVSSGVHDAPTGVSPEDRIPVPLVRYALSGELIDTVGWAPRPPPRMWRPPAQEEEYRTVAIGGRTYMVPMPFTTLPNWLPTPDGYLISATPLAPAGGEGVILLTRMGLAEDTLFHRRISYTPESYREAELDTIALNASRGSTSMASRAGGSRPEPAPEVAARLRAEMSFPEHKLPIDQVRLGQDEGIWMRRYHISGDTATWVLLDAAGELRGELELPARARILWSEGDRFLAAVPDELDVPWVVRYRIVPAS